MNNKYYIKLTAVTPLSVGAGNDAEWVKCADYVVSNDKVYVLDLHEVAKAGVDLKKLSLLFLNRDEEGIVRLLGNRIEDVSQCVFDLPCSTDNNIKSFERSQLHNLPVVAGSSLKGALRSVLFNYLRDNNETKNEQVFGKLNDGTDCMRFIKVRDIEMPDTQLFNTKIFNLRSEGKDWKGGWKHGKTNTSEKYRPDGFNTFYECVAPNVSGIGSIMLSPTQFNAIVAADPNRVTHRDDKEQLVNERELTGLFRIVNRHTSNYLTKERAFFEKYQAEKSEKILDSIDNLLGMIPADNSTCLLKMSAGVGFHSITGDWQHPTSYFNGVFDRKRNKGNDILPKSRKIVAHSDGLSLMGFVQLSLSSEAEYLAYVSGLHNPREARALAAREKAEQAEARRREAEEKEQKYAEILKEAAQAEMAGKYQEAIDKATEAKNLLKGRLEADSIIASCKAKLSEMKLQNARQEQEAAIVAARSDKYGKPLAEVLSDSKYIATDVSKWTKVPGNEFGEKEYQTLLELLKPLDVKQARSALKSKKDMAKAMRSEALATRLFDELGLK